VSFTLPVTFVYSSTIPPIASALSIIQTAAAWLGLPVPQAAYGTTDPQTLQLCNLLNEEGMEVVTWPDHAWTRLTTEKTFTTVAQSVQTGAVPADFGRFCDGSMWDRTTDRPVWGPMSAQQWQQQMAGPTFTTMYLGFRIRGNDFLITPTPAAGDTIAYEYVSNLYVYSAINTSATPNQNAFQADGDTSIFDGTMLARGLRWRFLRAKGLPYEQEYASWIEMLQRFVARDGGMPKLSASENYPLTRRSPFVPDAGFGAP
jgi:hypothetical protein